MAAPHVNYGQPRDPRIPIIDRRVNLQESCYNRLVEYPVSHVVYQLAILRPIEFTVKLTANTSNLDQEDRSLPWVGPNG